MFRPHHDFGAPCGPDLFAELGIDPAAVRETIEDDRAIRCPERAAFYPEYGFASLSPEPAFGHALHEPAPPDRCPGQASEPWDPASSLPPA